MDRPGFSIARLMAVIAAFALVIAVFRAAMSVGGVVVETTAAFGLIGVALLVAIERRVRGRRELRSFWNGFIALGAGAATSLAACAFWEPPLVSRLWDAYFNRLDVLLGKAPQLRRVVLNDQGLHFLVVAVYMALPQIVLAIGGGMAALFIGKSRSIREL